GSGVHVVVDAPRLARPHVLIVRVRVPVGPVRVLLIQYRRQRVELVTIPVALMDRTRRASRTRLTLIGGEPHLRPALSTILATPHVQIRHRHWRSAVRLRDAEHFDVGTDLLDRIHMNRPRPPPSPPRRAPPHVAVVTLPGPVLHRTRRSGRARLALAGGEPQLRPARSSWRAAPEEQSRHRSVRRAAGRRRSANDGVVSDLLDR